MASKLSAMVNDLVYEAAMASPAVWSHRLLINHKTLVEVLVKHLAALVEQIDKEETVLVGGRHAVHLHKRFRSTNASNSSMMAASSLALRMRQINIQQKLVRQIRLMTRVFCDSNQHAQPVWRPRTKRPVSALVELCITLSPASAKSSTRIKMQNPFFCFLAFR